MTCPAKGSRSEVSIALEDENGVSPTGNGSYQMIPFQSNSIGLTREYFEDSSIYPNRQKSFGRLGNHATAGDLVVSYAHETYDHLLCSLMMADWTNNILRIGQTVKTLSVQCRHHDKDITFVHRGCRVNSFNIDVNSSGVVSSTFGVIGIDTDTPAAPLDADPTSSPEKQPFTHLEGSFRVDGANVGYMTSVSLNFDNRIEADYSLGSKFATCLSSSEAMVEGTVVAHFVSLELYERFVQEERSILQFFLSDGNGNSHNFTLGNVLFTGADLPVSDGGSISVTLPFMAFFDPARNSILQITRVQDA